jgi:peptidoglycan/LPS O-acetylase OafA/YrhL
MLFHLGITVPHLRAFGVSATVVFFLVSGFAITGLIQGNYNRLSLVPSFIVDRLLRLYPQFLLYAALAVVVVRSLNLQTPYIDTHCSYRDYFVNFALALVFQPYSGSVFNSTWRECKLISQAWTLGLEIQIYLILILLLIFGHLRKMLLISWILFVIGFLRVIEIEFFIYIYPPATLFIFLTGSLLLNPSPRDLAIVASVWVTAVVGLLVARHGTVPVAAWGYDVLLGVVVGIPAMLLARRSRSSGWDAKLGAMSYGIYLNHVIIMLAARVLLPVVPPSGVAEVLVTLPIASAAAWITFSVVERPCTRWRRRRRVLATIPMSSIAVQAGSKPELKGIGGSG